jgi:hypothetical protein
VTIRRQLFICMLGILAGQASLLAQFSTKPLTIEMSAYGGGSFDFPGATSASGGYSFTSTIPKAVFVPGRKSQPIVGGEVGVSVTKFLWLYGDYGYMFPNSQQASATIPLTATVNTTDVHYTTRHYWTATGGVELSFPTVHRVVPFLRLGGGYVHHSYNVYWPGIDVRLGNTRYYDPGLQIVKGENIPAVTFGGGIRWYWSERQGLRFLVEDFRLGHGVTDLARSAIANTSLGYGYVTRRSGGGITVGYFVHFGR